MSSTNRCREACVVHRFQQVMQRMNVECPQNMLLIRCQKNDCGQAFSRQRPQHFKTVHSGHLDVEEHTSGDRSRILSTADCPSAHSPTISTSLNLRSLRTTPRRAKGSSSTIRARTVKPPAGSESCVTA